MTNIARGSSQHSAPFVISPALHDAPAGGIALAHALLRQASSGSSAELIRAWTPSSPTVAFGRRDVRVRGAAAAIAASRDNGFTPVLRAVGGHVLAYTADALVIDHICRQPMPGAQMHHRFEIYAALLSRVLNGLGVDARIGAVPGEYCPGEYSVNARGGVKLVGTAQRVVKDAWLFSSVVITGGVAQLIRVLPAVTGELGLDFDPDSVGSTSTEVAGLSAHDVRDAILAALVEQFPAAQLVVDEDLGADVVATADELLPNHQL